MADPTISQLRAKLGVESIELNVRRATVIAAQDELAEAESRYRTQRIKVSDLIDEINNLDRKRILEGS